jgi:hypothetical protein
LLIVITPSATLKAPVMQALTHKGSWQWRQETAKLISPRFSTLILGLIFTFLSAIAISFSFVPAKAQQYSQRWQAKHHFSFA